MKTHTQTEYEKYSDTSTLSYVCYTQKHSRLGAVAQTLTNKQSVLRNNQTQVTQCH